MRYFRRLKQVITNITTGCVMTVGNYDGIHLGHQQILAKVTAKAKELNLPSVVLIFEPQPQEYFAPKSDFARLTSLREKLSLFAKYNIDYVVCLRFTILFAAFSAEQFIEQVLLQAFKVKYLVVGDDFVFGKNRSGDFALLQQYAEQNNFQVEVVPAYKIHGTRVSSTLIRSALMHDNLKLAQQLLGRTYSLFGRVVHGDQRGRGLGFPTANVYLSHKVLPIAGVYVVKILGLNSRDYFGVANIGQRPTVGQDLKPQLEVYIFNFAADIYGQKIQVEFLAKIRQEQKFASFELLQQQIDADVIQAKNMIAEELCIKDQ